MQTSRFNEYFGFTQKEVDEILKDAGRCLSMSEQIKEWYDGYHFGDVDVYCPWDVMNYVRDLQDASLMQNQHSYWKNTSDNAIIRSFIDYAGKQYYCKNWRRCWREDILVQQNRRKSDL